MNAHAFMTELVTAYFGERPTLRPGQKVSMRFGGINCAPRLEPGVVEEILQDGYAVIRRADGRIFRAHPQSLLVVVCEAD
jgi:hypothetical protein